MNVQIAETLKALVIKFANKIAALHTELAEAYVNDRYNVNRTINDILKEISDAQIDLRTVIVRLEEVTR